MCTGRSEALDPLELESEAVVSHPTWVLGIKLLSSARVVSTLTAKPSLHHHHRHLLPLNYQTITIPSHQVPPPSPPSLHRCDAALTLLPVLWLGGQVATICGGNFPLEFLFVPQRLALLPNAPAASPHRDSALGKVLVSP